MKQEIIINNFQISAITKSYVIAEIGGNHQGDLETVKLMFKIAKECGADAVKLQKRSSYDLYTREMLDKPYEGRNSFGKTYLEHREALEFGLDEYKELIHYAKEVNITFFATPFDWQSADFLKNLDMPVYKIGSGDLKNTPFQEYVAKFNKPVLLSTGGGTLEDVKRAYNAIMPFNKELCIMQCTSTYPVKPSMVNLNVLNTYRSEFPDVVLGFSNHSKDLKADLMAFAMGARIIEKHFTLDSTQKGSDHIASIEPNELKELCNSLNDAYLMLGDGIKKPFEEEEKALMKVNKRLVAANNLKKGTVITNEDISIKSASSGLFPYEINQILGKTIISDLTKDEPFSLIQLTN
ncbi:MAG: hypothetical protein ACD_79C00287G0013 [uncultured bacterium]|nr:MAG: hypothetical protein ACD_79C00287G0013 [uncultured bacterium]